MFRMLGLQVDVEVAGCSAVWSLVCRAAVRAGVWVDGFGLSVRLEDPEILRRARRSRAQIQSKTAMPTRMLEQGGQFNPHNVCAQATCKTHCRKQQAVSSSS